MGGKATPLNDDSSPRLLKSELFEPLRGNRMLPFYAPTVSYGNLNSVLFDNHLRNYIPHTSNFEPQYDGYAFDFLELEESEAERLDLKRNYPFDRIIPLLFENLADENLEHNFAHLHVIQHLWEARLIPDVWNQITNNRKRRTLCRELIQQNYENLPEFISDVFVEFLNQQGASHQENWNDFTSRLDRMTPEIWQDYRTNIPADLMVPWQCFIGETYVTQFETTLSDFLEKDSIEYFEGAIFADYLEADSNGKLIRFEEPVFVLSESLAEKFRQFAGLNINNRDLEGILFHDSIDSEESSEVANLAYLSPMLRHFGVALSVQFKPIDQTDFNNLGSEPIRFSLDWEGDNLTVYCSDEVTLTIHQHQWLMSYLKTKLIEFVDEEEKNDNVRFPWSWRDRNDEDTLDAKLKFAQRYCEITTIEQLQPNGYEAIETLQQLEHHLNQLIQLYRNKDAVLNYTVTLAYDKYVGMQTIRTCGMVLQGGIWEPELRSPVSIPGCMVGSRNEVGQKALGDTLLVATSEAQLFRRFTEHWENQEAYDLAPNTAEILRERLFAEGDEGWFGCQQLDYLFTFKDVFITSRRGDHYNACLWRVHALHILAFLEAEQFQWGG